MYGLLVGLLIVSDLVIVFGLIGLMMLWFVVKVVVIGE